MAVPVCDEGPALPAAVKVVKRELRRRRWSQNYLAELIGSNSGNMSRYLNGLLQPSLVMAVRLEEILGVPPRLWLKRA